MTTTEQRRGQFEWRDLVAGAGAGAATRFAIAPLDLLKIRFQILERSATANVMQALPYSRYRTIGQAVRTIAREEGVRGFWKGNITAITMVSCYSSVQFAVYAALHSYSSEGDLAVEDGQQQSAYIDGAIAGCTATLVSYPLDLIRTRMAAQREPRKYKTFVAMGRHVVHQSWAENAFLSAEAGGGGKSSHRLYKWWVGMRALYGGIVPTLMGIVPYAGLQFGFYEWIRSGMVKSMHLQHPSDLSAFACGAAGFGAGIASKLITMPLDVMKKQLQVQGMQHSAVLGDSQLQHPKHVSLRDCARHLYQQAGWKAFFRGGTMTLLKAGPNAGLTFLSFEFIKRAFSSNPEHIEF